METAVPSTSWPEDLRSWAATRLLRARVAILWLVLCVGMLAASPRSGAGRMAASALLAALLIAQFRLWDDLADRNFDARQYPRRVLVDSMHGERFGILCAGASLPILGLLLTWHEPWRLAVYGLLCTAIGAVYLAALPRLLRAHLVLLKYPCFICLAASGAPSQVLLGLGTIVWLALAACEMFSDKSLQASKYWRVLAGIECVALALAALSFTRPIY
jgi:hypothetical protein